MGLLNDLSSCLLDFWAYPPKMEGRQEERASPSRRESDISDLCKVCASDKNLSPLVSIDECFVEYETH